MYIPDDIFLVHFPPRRVQQLSRQDAQSRPSKTSRCINSACKAIFPSETTPRGGMRNPSFTLAQTLCCCYSKANTPISLSLSYRHTPNLRLVRTCLTLRRRHSLSPLAAPSMQCSVCWGCGCRGDDDAAFFSNLKHRNAGGQRYQPSELIHNACLR
ncbi:hypothetical protein BKA81DRAFT_133017 [Phyllosticta paracitricarpa]